METVYNVQIYILKSFLSQRNIRATTCVPRKPIAPTASTGHHHLEHEIILRNHPRHALD